MSGSFGGSFFCLSFSQVLAQVGCCIRLLYKRITVQRGYRALSRSSWSKHRQSEILLPSSAIALSFLSEFFLTNQGKRSSSRNGGSWHSSSVRCLWRLNRLLDSSRTRGAFWIVDITTPPSRVEFCPLRTPWRFWSLQEPVEPLAPSWHNTWR